nr:glutamate-gated chloride channel-like [Penaeus vannamei]
MTIQRREEDEYSVAVVGMIFYRRYWYYLTSAYLPTIMLMLISYASLFCKRDNRDLRVMMAITTLLVLYALYQQISDGLPRTSYTKAVDVWCFFAITFIFSQVISTWPCAIDVEMSWPRRVRASPRVKEIDLANKPRRRFPALVVARIVYALLLVFFCLIYWAVVLVDKNRGEMEHEF